MNDFLFVVPLTPKKFLTSIRKEIYDLFIRSMNQQTSTNWTALMIGEEDYVDGNYMFVDSGDAVIKKDKLVWTVEWLRKQPKKPKYIIRMDDDDLVNRHTLSDLEGLDFDMYRDRYYANYDISNAKIRMSRINWYPNTCIMKYEHFDKQPSRGDDMELLVSDHSLWHEYFQDMKVISAPKNHPFYLRILSPSCKTIYELVNETDQPDPTELNIDEYHKYVGDGNWRHRYLPDYEEYIPELIDIWERFYQTKIDRKLTLIDRVNPFPL